MTGPGSPVKRSRRPSSNFTGAHQTSNGLMGLNAASGSTSSRSSSSSRPQTPSLRRPASSVSLRSSTPTQFSRRPATPSLATFYAQHNASTSSLPKENVYSGNIKVSIRVKPVITTQAKVSISQDGSITTLNDHWSIDSDRHAISSKDVGEFSFDNIFHGQVDNSRVFELSVKELVEQVMAGFNGTVFAYGMTGSGKTYSMQGSQSNAGIIPLSVHAIFNHINSDPSATYTVKVSYLEIYNEHLHDLLCPQTQSEDIKLRDDLQRGVRALGLREVSVTTPDDLIATIQEGDILRRTEGTEFNTKSSRSHAVVQITVEASPKNKVTTLPRSSTLYLCDLAGSEKAASKTERRKEGAYINKSLLTLGTVIARLSVASSSTAALNTNGGHIPYRDSKLTRLLQPALSGKSLVSVLCTVDLCNMANNTESISTLRFAARAKNIMVNVKRSEEASDPNAKLIEKLLGQVEALKAENAQLRRNDGSTSTSLLVGSPSMVSTPQVAQLEAENRILHERVEHLTRLCDDNRLEELIGLGIDDGSSSGEGSRRANSTSTPPRPPSSLSHASSRLSDETVFSDEWRRKESEYKSYISHLEKQLYNQEVQKRGVNGHSPEIMLNSSVFSPTRANFNVTGMPSSQLYYTEVISELKEEIAELRESNSDKDRIISTLRSINKRKENLTALSIQGSNSSLNSYSSSGGSSSSSSLIGSPISSYHSPAYSRYYFSSAASVAASTPSILSPSLLNNSTPKRAVGLPKIPRAPSSSSTTENHYDDSTLTEVPILM